MGGVGLTHSIGGNQNSGFQISTNRKVNATQAPEYETIITLGRGWDPRKFFNHFRETWVNTYYLFNRPYYLSYLKAVMMPDNKLKKIAKIDNLFQNAFMVGDLQWAKAILSHQRNEAPGNLFSGGRVMELIKLYSGEHILNCHAEKNKTYRFLFKDRLNTSLETYVEPLKALCKEKIQSWLNSREPIDVSKEMPRFAAEAVASSLLGFRDNMEKICEAAAILMQNIAQRLFFVPSYFHDPRVGEARQTLERATEQVKTENNLLGDLKTAKNADNTPKFREDEIQANLKALFLGSMETTAGVLTYLLHQLGKYPEWQTKIEEEWKDAQANGVTLYKYLTASNTTLHAVILEILRLNPPTYIQSRDTVEDVYINDSDTRESFFIPKGSSIYFTNYYINRDPKNWERAEEFDPSRFFPFFKENKPIPMNPFSVGPNLCVGQYFAKLEIKLFLLELIGSAKWEATNDLQQIGLMTLSTVDSVYITIKKKEEIA